MAKVVEGVFVEGKPLEQFVEDQERDDKAREVEEVRKTAEKKPHKNRGSYADERTVESTKKVSKRVRYFTEREIRKEYGLMQKPFPTHAENAIWAILEKGPLKIKEIGREINWEGKDNSLSAMVAGVWARLGETHEHAAGILTRYHHGGAFVYKRSEKGVDISVEAAIDKYKAIGRVQHRAKVEKKKEATFNAGAAKPEEVELTAEPENGLTSAIEQALRQSLGIDVNVSGRIEFVFKLGDGK